MKSLIKIIMFFQVKELCLYFVEMSRKVTVMNEVIITLQQLKVPDMIHNIIPPPIFFQTHRDFDTKSLVIFF